MPRISVERLEQTEWFGPLMKEVQAEMDRLSASQIDRRPALAHEQQELQGRITGWTLSLGKAELSAELRTIFEREMSQALQRMRDLQRELMEYNAQREQTRRIADPQQVADSLDRLDEVLSRNDPTRTNLELSLHIDSIRCFPDGRVVVRTCKLGALGGVANVFVAAKAGQPGEEAAAEDNNVVQATPRRRTLLRTERRDEQGHDLRAAAAHAADVHRFAGLGPEWFWEEHLQVPPKRVWYKDNAAAVAAKKAETGWSLDSLADFFDVSIPTIQKALGMAGIQRSDHA